MSSLMCLVLRGESRLLLLPWESVLAPGVSKGPENMSFHRVMTDTNYVIYCSESRRHPQHCLKIGRSTDSPTHSNHARTPRIGARSSAWNAISKKGANPDATSERCLLTGNGGG